MTAAVKQLVRRFEAELRAVALEQLVARMGGYFALERLVAPARRSRRRRRRRAPPRPVTVRLRRRPPRAPTPARPAVTVVTAVTSAAPAIDPRPVYLEHPRAVVVRIDGNPSKIALLEGAPAPGFYSVRLARGRGKYSPKRRRIIERELLRDATPRELELGYVVPGLTS